MTPKHTPEPGSHAADHPYMRDYTRGDLKSVIEVAANTMPRPNISRSRRQKTSHA